MWADMLGTVADADISDTGATAGVSRGRSTRQYDESDVRIRPGKSSRPRTKTRPVHADAASAMVVSVDRGRWGCAIDADPAGSSSRCAPANWAAPQSSSATASVSSGMSR